MDLIGHTGVMINPWRSVTRPSLCEGVWLLRLNMNYMIVFLLPNQIAPLEWCKSSDRGLPAPDVVFYLKLSAKAAQQRAEFGTERYEKMDFQRDVEQQFEALRDSDWHELDASRDIESLHAEILRTTKQVIQEKRTTPLAALWTNTMKK